MNIVVLLAGGIGERMHSSIPKQHLLVSGHQIIEYTLMAFSKSKDVDAILVVSNLEYMQYIIDLKQNYPKLKWVIGGGSTRIDSVHNAVSYLHSFCNGDDLILISDAVRPCITTLEISQLFSSLSDHVASTTCIEVYETVLKSTSQNIESIIHRDGLYRQTSPEGYRFSILEMLYIYTDKDIVKQYSNIGIDQLFSKGIDIGLVKTSPLNIKITNPFDLYFFELILHDGFDKFLSSNEVDYTNFGTR